MKTKHVRQVDEFGCGLACLAMVMNTTYDEVQTMFSIFNGRGVYTRQVDEFLASYGFAVARYFKRTFLRGNSTRGNKREHWPIKPFAPIHICLVKVKPESKFNHFIIMLDNGIILDPDKEGTHTLDSYHDILHIAGIVGIRGKRG